MYVKYNYGIIDSPLARINNIGTGYSKKNDYLIISNNIPRIYMPFMPMYFKFFQRIMDIRHQETPRAGDVSAVLFKNARRAARGTTELTYPYRLLVI